MSLDVEKLAIAFKRRDDRISELLAALEKCEDALNTAGHFEAWDSEAQKNYPFRDSLASCEALDAIRAVKGEKV